MNRASAAAIVALGALLAPPVGADGYAAAPFHDQPREVAQAAALTLLAARAEALAVEPVEPEDADEFVKAIRSDAGRVLATLARVHPERAAKLAGAVAALGAAAEEDASGGQANAAAELLRAAETAEAALAAAFAKDAPAFRAAVVATLLLSEAGLAEAYEDAAEGEAGAYAVARATLDRVLAILPPLRARMAEERGRDADEILSRLRALLPAEAGGEPAFSDPEEAEVLAQGLVGLLERAADADLYLSRDLSRALGTVRSLVASGCAEADAALGREAVAVAQFYHEDALEAPLAILAAEAQETAEEAYGVILAGAGLDGAGCAMLIGALYDARGTLFPEVSQ